MRLNILNSQQPQLSLRDTWNHSGVLGPTNQDSARNPAKLEEVIILGKARQYWVRFRRLFLTGIGPGNREFPRLIWGKGCLEPFIQVDIIQVTDNNLCQWQISSLTDSGAQSGSLRLRYKSYLCWFSSSNFSPSSSMMCSKYLFIW